MIRIPLMAGEIPESLSHTFLDADGNVMDLTGFSASATWEHRSSGTTGTLTCTSGDSTGVITATVTAAAVATTGVVDVVIWVGNSTFRYASPIWRLAIADPPGTAPSI